MAISDFKIESVDQIILWLTQNNGPDCLPLAGQELFRLQKHLMDLVYSFQSEAHAIRSHLEEESSPSPSSSLSSIRNQATPVLHEATKKDASQEFAQNAKRRWEQITPNASGPTDLRENQEYSGKFEGRNLKRNEEMVYGNQSHSQEFPNERDYGVHEEEKTDFSMFFVNKKNEKARMSQKGSQNAPKFY